VSVVVMFVLVGAGIAGWWLFASQLTAKPWERKQGEADNEFGGATLAVAPAKVGLWMFLAVVTSFFGLLVSAYGMRMELADWRPLSVPDLLWVNTAMLVLGSVAFQWTKGAALREDADSVKSGLIASGVFSFAFIAGQLLAWRHLNASEQFVAGSIAIAFFYLLTGIHGLHLLGGLVAWGRTTASIWRGGTKPGEVRASIELCTVYWHFLLVVWLVLFALLLSRSSLRNIWLGICSAVGYGQ